MIAQKLDFSALTKAIGSMEEALNAYQKKSTDNFIRDASIQRFEYTYELCHKFLRRYLALNEPSAEVVHEMSFPELIRTSSLRGLIEGDWGKWQRLLGLGVHLCDENKPESILQQQLFFVTNV